MEFSNDYQPRVTSNSKMIVRSFTETLNESSALAVETKETQRKIDVKIEKRERLRREQLFRDSDSSSNPFQESELVMTALQRALDQFFEGVKKKEKDSKLRGLWKKKQSTESQVEQQIRQSNSQNLDDVKSLVLGMADEWTRSHGKIYSAFNRMCQTLDAHSTLFKMVPSQNTYAAVLSGALSMIVQASVYHTEIADNLSKAAAHLCQRVATCSQFAHVIQKNSMQMELAEIYKHLFLFLLDIAKWFNKPSFSRFFDSFNKALQQEHDVAVSTINDYVDKITDKGRIEGLVRIEDARQTGDIIESKLDLCGPKIANIEQHLETLVDQARTQGQFQQHQLPVGSMLNLLCEQVHWTVREALDQYLLTVQNSRLVLNKEEVTHEIIVADPNTFVTREEADLKCRKLRAMIYGTDGIDLAQENRARLIDMNIISRLALWIQDASRKSQTLWIDFPFGFHEDSPAIAAALSVISVAARANAPFLSYICRKPRQVELTDSQSPDNAGLFSIVYSLILQLLRFRPQEDTFKFNRNQLAGLSGNISSWCEVLDLLDDLLKHTTIVRYCIIHGLNEFETKEGGIRCNDLLKVLFSHCDRPENPFSMLFTTSGQSRVLNGVIDRKDRTTSDESMREVNKRGMELDLRRM